jgi:DNA-binding response OmpR family regulator
MTAKNAQPLIMVVDDSSSVRQQFQLAFKADGLDVIGFADAESALAHLHLVDHGISAAVLDYRLPGIDGITLARQMRAHQNWTTNPIVMCSTTTDSLTLKKAKDVGVDGWAVKPFHPRKFISTIRLLLDRRAPSST